MDSLLKKDCSSAGVCLLQYCTDLQISVSSSISYGWSLCLKDIVVLLVSVSSSIVYGWSDRFCQVIGSSLCFPGRTVVA